MHPIFDKHKWAMPQSIENGNIKKSVEKVEVGLKSFPVNIIVVKDILFDLP